MPRGLNIVVAACDNMGIGIEGGIPWRLRKDMDFFKSITMKTKQPEKRNAVIMGRKTWESIPKKFRPLEKRLNIVISSTLSDTPSGVIRVANFQDALQAADSDDIERIFVIGGSSVYQEAMITTVPCTIFFTRVKGTFRCDTFFPHIDPTIFVKNENSDEVPEGEFKENDVTFSFEVYDKS